jgi:hypothetical protein
VQESIEKSLRDNHDVRIAAIPAIEQVIAAPWWPGSPNRATTDADDATAIVVRLKLRQYAPALAPDRRMFAGVFVGAFFVAWSVAFAQPAARLHRVG